VDPGQVERIVSGVARGCTAAGCALVGGETAELGELYAPGEYDLAGFVVGVAEERRLVTGREVAPGDRVLGLASSGLHSNGYTLARRAILERLGLGVRDVLPRVGRSVADELLEPTRIYVRPVLELLRQAPVHAMAHVTGGGLTGNLPRVLPEGRRAVLHAGAWPVPPVFGVIQDAAGVGDDEMRRTFNLGLGFLLVVPAGAAADARRILTAAGERVFEVGEIRAGPRGVEYA